LVFGAIPIPELRQAVVNEAPCRKSNQVVSQHQALNLFSGLSDHGHGTEVFSARVNPAFLA
jgi:hypothetical protein